MLSSGRVASLRTILSLKCHAPCSTFEGSKTVTEDRRVLDADMFTPATQRGPPHTEQLLKRRDRKANRRVTILILLNLRHIVPGTDDSAFAPPPVAVIPSIDVTGTLIYYTVGAAMATGSRYILQYIETSHLSYAHSIIVESVVNTITACLNKGVTKGQNCPSSNLFLPRTHSIG